MLIKLPVPVPSLDLESEIVGFAVKAQQVPLAVTAPPPSAVILPPATAEFNVINVAAVVARVGTATGLVTNWSSLP